MRARLFTADGEIGVVDLVDGVDVVEVVHAMREHRLFCTPLPPEQAAPSPATELGAPDQPAAAPDQARRRQRRGAAQ